MAESFKEIVVLLCLICFFPTICCCYSFYRAIKFKNRQRSQEAALRRAAQRQDNYMILYIAERNENRRNQVTRETATATAPQSILTNDVESLTTDFDFENYENFPTTDSQTQISSEDLPPTYDDLPPTYDECIQNFQFRKM